MKNGETGAKSSWFARHKVLTGFFVLVLLIVVVSVSNDPATNHSTSSSSAGETAAIEVSAQQLSADYEKNELAADSKYKDKVLQVTGTVQSVGKDLLENPYVSLSGNSAIFGVQCYLDAAMVEKASSLKKGVVVTMQGQDVSKFGNVILKRCTFKE